MAGQRDYILLAACFVAAYVLVVPPHMVWVQARPGTRTYVRNMPGKEEVAARLVVLEDTLRRFVGEAHRARPDDPRILRILQRWDGTLSEIESTRENVAFSISKTSIVVCVREPDGKISKMNTCIFVLIHELAHIASEKYGHTKDFWRNMKFLLELAEAAGIYTETDHDPNDETLCGKRVGSSPIACVKKSTCKSEL